MKTAIVILNYNNYEDTINCVNSVEEHNTAEIVYYVVDNCSSKENVVCNLDNYFSDKFPGNYQLVLEGELMSSVKKLNFIVSQTNDGYANGNNKALRFIFTDDTIDNILILNNDVIFVEDIIPKLEKSLYSLDKCAIVSPILYHKDLSGIDYNCARKNHKDFDFWLIYLLLKRNYFGFEAFEADKRYLLKHLDYAKTTSCIEIEMPSGSCMLIKKELFSQIGGFDPKTFLYFEENILHKKIEKLKLKNYLNPTVKCIHLGGMSTGKSSSYFVNLKGLESAWYYAVHYTRLNKVQLLILKIALSFNKYLLKLKEVVR